MKGILVNTLKYTLFFGLAAWLTFSALEDIKFSDILKTWEEANKWPIFMSGIAVMLSHLFRALRWKLMLKPMGFKFSTWNSYLSILVGYGVNIVVPRGGELARGVNLSKLDGVPVKTSLGTVISERIIDLVFLLTMMGLAFILEFDQLLSTIVDFLAKGEGADKSTDPTKLILLGVILLVVSTAVIFILKSAHRAVLRFKIKLKNFAIGLFAGLKSIFNLEHNVLFLFYSFLIWFLYYLMAYFVVLAFAETGDLGFVGALMILVLGSIAMAMPMPGGAGAYHHFVPFGLEKLYKIAIPIGTAFATIFHAWQTLIHLLVGGLSIIISLVLIRNGKNKEKN